MFRKYWTVTLRTAAHRNPRPTVDAMYGQMMYSPDPTPSPARITLGPRTLLSGSGLGMSLYGIGGRLPFGTASKNSGGAAVVFPSTDDVSHAEILSQAARRVRRIVRRRLLAPQGHNRIDSGRPQRWNQCRRIATPITSDESTTKERGSNGVDAKKHPLK